MKIITIGQLFLKGFFKNQVNLNEFFFLVMQGHTKIQNAANF
jgi:hypothetical protein